VVDFYSGVDRRGVIGWAVSDRLKRDLPIEALERAIALRRRRPGVIHHSERGSQYCSNDYRKLLKDHGFLSSLSGKGNCSDNAAVETFFKSLKAELIWRDQYGTREQAQNALFGCINEFYNPRCRHSYLGIFSPINFEKMAG